MKHLKELNDFLNERIDVDLMAVDMIDYYGNELPKKAEDAKDFAKSRDITDQSAIKKIWDKAKYIQKNGIDEDYVETVNEKHWDSSDVNPKVKVGDTFDNFATSKGYRDKVVYVSKATGAFVVQKVTEYGVASREFYIFRKEGSDRWGGAYQLDSNLDLAIKKADAVTGSYGPTHRRN
jgi:hypothetical protein